MNMPIELDGVYIDPGDLVFADRDGVVVIPAAIEDKVLTQAMRTLLSERHIMGDVCSDLDVGDLVDKHGYF
jgi:regulator of RNase E activity RraA